MEKSWFVDLIEKEIQKRGGNVAKLAADIGVGRTTVDRWLDKEKPSSPTLPKVETVIKALGGDIHRAFPAFGTEHETDNSPTVSNPITIYGDVAAGSATEAFEVEKTYESLEDIWSESIYRRFTRSRVVYLRIAGQSMEPDYPAGSLLACAEPSVKEIKPLTPVIAYVRGEQATFKLFNTVENTSGKKEIELIPINRAFFPKRHKPAEVTVKYIVLGTINPWHTGLKPVPEPKGPVLIDDGPRHTGPFKVEV